MVRTRLLPLTLALMTTAASVTAMVAVTPFLATEAVAQVSIDDRPAAELSDEELTARFRAAQQAARDPATDDELRKRLRDQVRADRAELQRRKVEAASGGKAEPGGKERREKRKAAPEPEEQPAEQQAAPEPEEQPAEQQAAPEPEEQPAEQQAAPEPEEQPAEQQAAPEQAEQPTEQQAAPERKERRKRQAAPEPEEQPAEQQAAPEPAEQPTEQQAAPEQAEQEQATPERKERRKRQATPEPEERPAEQQAAPEPAEQPTEQQATPEPGEQPARRTGDRQRRQTGSEQQAQPQEQQQAPEQATRRSGEGDRRAQEILRSRRDAEQLKDDRLRQRLDIIREILSAGTVSSRYERELLELLESDRREMRRRVRTERDGDRRRADRGRYSDDDRDGLDRRDLRQLLRDDRPSGELSNAALTARSEAIREALDDRRLRPGQVARLREMLRSDRGELRSRLRAEREDRRRELRRKGQAGGLRIEIEPRGRPAPRRSIAAAEVDEEEIESQLVAPPTRRIERQYSFQEYARRPELREVMPGIELDTINFGFNEYVVREEEIAEIDRIGEIIERILATNPDEVFVVEGHTDAVGSDAYNLELSRKRAAAVRDALLEYFVIDPASIETIGYGERYLKIPTEAEEVENRRVTVRRITPILQSSR